MTGVPDPVILVRQALWHALYREVPLVSDLTPLNIAYCRDRMEQFVDRYGEDRTLQMIRESPGLGTITMELARTFLDRTLW